MTKRISRAYRKVDNAAAEVIHLGGITSARSRLRHEAASLIRQDTGWRIMDDKEDRIVMRRGVEIIQFYIESEPTEQQFPGSKHGGSRPATSPDDGRHHNGGHLGTGPKPKKVTLQLGGIHFAHVRTGDGKQVGPSLMLEITRVDRDCIELTDQHTGHIYHIVR